MKGRTVYIVLGMLSIQPMTGYEIRQEIKSSTGFFWSESDGQLYPTLAQCEENGYVNVQSVEATKAGKEKKRYGLTKKGRSYLNAWLVESVRKTTARNELLLKLFFGANVSVEENIAHLQTKRRELKQSMSIYQLVKENLEKNEKNSPHLPYWLMTLDYGLAQAETSIIWCDNSIKQLKEMRINGG